MDNIKNIKECSNCPSFQSVKAFVEDKLLDELKPYMNSNVYWAKKKELEPKLDTS
jgi:hypothetical protein